jgi:hypothetical protein
MMLCKVPALLGVVVGPLGGIGCEGGQALLKEGAGIHRVPSIGEPWRGRGLLKAAFVGGYREYWR